MTRKETFPYRKREHLVPQSSIAEVGSPLLAQAASLWYDNGVKIERMDNHTDVRDKRNHAAAELFRLTGNSKWHDVFVETTKLNKSDVDLYVWKSHEQSQAAWAYVNTRRLTGTRGERRSWPTSRHGTATDPGRPVGDKATAITCEAEPWLCDIERSRF